jgi:hypothetical protein
MGIKHGAFALTKAIKAGKTLDKRTRMCKQMAVARENLLAECGGEPTQAQLILLDRIMEKMVFLIAISNYAMDQECVVDEKGKLIACLGQSYLSYSEALRRDLLAFKGLSSNDKDKKHNLESYVRSKYGDDSE